MPGLARKFRHVVLCSLLMCFSLRAEDQSLVGKNVYPRSPTIQVTDGERVLATGAELGFPIAVRRQTPIDVVVWVSQAGQEGQIARRDVLTAAEAIPVFCQRVAQNPENLYDAFVLSLIWEDLGQIDQALDVVSGVLQKQTHAIFFNRRGNLWQRKQAYQQAIRDYNASLRLEPDSVACVFNRGLAWSHLGRDDLAIADFDAVLKLSPLNASAFVARGSSWKIKGQVDQAIADYTMALILNPDEVLAYQERANLWFRRGKHWQALADYQEVIRLRSGTEASGAYLNRGLAQVKLGLYGLALSDFERAVQTDQSNATAYNNRGWIRATCPEKSYRNGRLALADARRACELTQWNNSHHLSTLGEAFAELGQFTTAIEWQERAAALHAGQFPKDAEFQSESRERLANYRAGKPFRERRSPTPTGFDVPQHVRR